MIELTKGDEENLEGRVIVYSKLKGDDFSQNILAMYVATNPVDFKENVGAPQEIFDEMDKEMKKAAEKFKQEGIESKIMPVYVTFFPIESEVDLKLGSEDVVFVGEWSNPKSCIEAVNAGIHFYLMRLTEQMTKTAGIDKVPEQEETPAPTYKDIDGESIRGYLLDNYIIPISDALNVHNNPEKAKALKEDFIRFSAGAPFATDVFRLCEILGRSDNNLVLMDAYLEKIVAVHVEDYKTAAKMRDKIKELS